MNLDALVFIMSYVVPLIMLVMKFCIMWALWSLLLAATRFLRVLTERADE